MIPLGADPIRPRPESQYSSSKVGVPGRPNIIVATIDPQIRQGMGELFQGYRVNTLWASGIEEVRSTLAEQQDVLACFCGFWLVDGTYREVVRLLKQHRAEIPMIVVCSPECPQEYRDYLAALNIRAFDFICHPYHQIDLERILESAAALRSSPLRSPALATRSSDRSFDTSELRRAS
jgi:DNA-binding NtrC family response regulator